MGEAAVATQKHEGAPAWANPLAVLEPMRAGHCAIRRWSHGGMPRTFACRVLFGNIRTSVAWSEPSGCLT